MQVNCPTCKKSVKWSTDNAHRPFCSKKCQLIDLGEWAAEEKKIAGQAPVLSEQEQAILNAMEDENFDGSEDFFKH